MSDFAVFRKCDFQVHSPRDPGWKGEKPAGIEDLNPDTGVNYTIEEVDDARTLWARGFVDECVDRGLQAVALTDHHEMVMAHYIKKELELREIVDAPDLWFFPGMELTLKNKAQCLILLDSDLDETLWNDIQSKLGITVSNINTHSAVSGKVEQLEFEYEKLDKFLKAIKAIKGKYIILPNVSEGGNHTVLKEGHHQSFKNMPYVGGYLDNCKNINDLGTKNKTRLSGEAPIWGDRYIYPLPTSDTRRSDYENLGKNNAWIKAF